MTYLGEKNCEKCGKEMIIKTTQKKYCIDCRKIEAIKWQKIWLKKPENMKKHKTWVKNWQLNNKEKIKIDQKNNSNFKSIQKRWGEKNKPYKNLKQKEYMKNNPLKVLARELSHNFKKKPYCEICNSKKNLEKHHWRYDKPLLINTLCKQCHTIQHIKNFGGYLIQT